jgi:ABC-type branched-subunit amino acid transport system ATPase component
MRHLTSLKELSKNEILELLDLADNFFILEKGRTVWNGPSTQLTSKIAQEFLGV